MIKKILLHRSGINGSQLHVASDVKNRCETTPSWANRSIVKMKNIHLSMDTFSLAYLIPGVRFLYALPSLMWCNPMYRHGGFQICPIAQLVNKQKRNVSEPIAKIQLGELKVSTIASTSCYRFALPTWISFPAVKTGDRALQKFFLVPAPPRPPGHRITWTNIKGTSLGLFVYSLCETSVKFAGVA